MVFKVHIFSSSHFWGISMLQLFLYFVVALSLSNDAVAATPYKKDIVERDDVPVIPIDFPDPNILMENGVWYAFASNNGKHNIQWASATSPMGPWTVANTDAMPGVGAWSNGANVWAPDVIKRDDGTFVMYYSANAASSPAQHCVGAATSTNITGPYEPVDTVLACPIDNGGSIDPTAFKDTDGTHYVVYKVDGNSIGHGGTCGNSVYPLVSTPLMLQRLRSDAVTPVGDPVQLLDRSEADGPLIEAPNLIRTDDGVYVLFFSSNCYSTVFYDISYATSRYVTGPFTKSSTPLLVTGKYGLTAPGGASVLADGSGMVFHANCDIGRCMHYMDLSMRLITMTGASKQIELRSS